MNAAHICPLQEEDENQRITEEKAELMIEEAELCSERHGQHQTHGDDLDRQLTYDEFVAVLSVLDNNENDPSSSISAADLPTTRVLWLKLRLRLKLAETVSLLKNEAVMGYKQNLSDASVRGDGKNTAEQRRQDAHIKQQWCMILPDSWIRVLWDVISACFLVYLLIVLPVVIGMDIEVDYGGTMHIIDLVMDAFFLVDIVLNFRTSFHHQTTGRLVYHPKEIAKAYLKVCNIALRRLLFSHPPAAPLSCMNLKQTKFVGRDGFPSILSHLPH
eukprot:SAG31_NODE_774_length_12192_cov_26.736128_12_plen_273_part_00